jgi:ABC-type polysaccharide/polyol phosphate transport system ATPase subunit
MGKSIAISLQHVTKKYTFHHEKPTFIENIFKPTKSESFIALNDISLTIEKGQKIGIIGPNGAGKTTLLKIISGITSPTSGKVLTNGKIVSLIDISAGFHPELSGRKNMYLNGLLIGMTKKEISDAYEQIVTFSGIKKFIDAPLYTYSEGMKLRLGFSIAIKSNPDILILDEAISAGDQRFQAKIKKALEKFFKEQKTVLVVSHWTDFLIQNTQKCLLIKNGRIALFDHTPQVINHYKLD